MINIRATYQDSLGNTKYLSYPHLQDFIEYIQDKREVIFLDKVYTLLQDKCILNKYPSTSSHEGHITYKLPEDQEVEVRFSKYEYKGRSAELVFGILSSDLRFVRI